MYAIVPTTIPVSVIRATPSCSAIPKSDTTARPLVIDQYICRLHIAMNRSVVVRVLESGRDLCEDESGHAKVEARAPSQQRIKTASVDVLHQDGVCLAILPDAVYRDYVRVLQRRDRSCLAEEARGHRRVLREIRQQDFDGDATLQRCVASQEDSRHAATANLRFDVELAAEHRSNAS